MKSYDTSPTIGLNPIPQQTNLNTTPPEVIYPISVTMPSIPAVATEPGWYVVGAVSIHSRIALAKLEVVGSVSNEETLTLSVRLYDLTGGQTVAGQVDIQSTADTRMVTGGFALQPERIYQLQVQVVGGEGDDYFGRVKLAQLISP